MKVSVINVNTLGQGPSPVYVKLLCGARPLALYKEVQLYICGIQ